MPRTVTIQAIRQVGNRRYVRFTNGHEREFPNLSEFQAMLDDIDEELLENIALLIIRHRLPNLTNVSQLEGRGVSVNLANANWGTLI